MPRHMMQAVRTARRSWSWAALWCFAKGIADNVFVKQLSSVLRQYRLTLKGKPPTDADVKALKSLELFVGDAASGAAYSLMEAFCPELRQSTLLMRIAQLRSARVASAGTDERATARASPAFIFDCLRVYRLTGEYSKDDVYTVAKRTGQEETACAGAPSPQ